MVFDGLHGDGTSLTSIMVIDIFSTDYIIEMVATYFGKTERGHMKRLFLLTLAIFIVLSFVLSSTAATIKKKNGAVATENIDKKASTQPKAKVDKSTADSSKETIKSKEVKGKTEKSVSKKTDKALGEGPSPVPIGPGPIGPTGKSTNTAK